MILDANNFHYTYLHCRPDGSPFYVGKGFGNRAYIFSQRNRHHKNIVSKYGRENIQIIIFKKSSEEDAFSYEKMLIKILKKDFNLSNYTDGGEGCSGRIISEETRRRISEKQKGKFVSDETRKKMSDSAKLKIVSDETRKKLSIARKGNKNAVGSKGRTGRKDSVERRLLLSKAHLGKKHTKEHVAKISSANTGKKRSPEIVEKMKLAWVKRKLNQKEKNDIR